MQRGVNIVGYDPLWRDASKARFKPRHFSSSRTGGLQLGAHRAAGRSVREGRRSRLPASWFATLDGLVNDALAQGSDRHPRRSRLLDLRT